MAHNHVPQGDYRLAEKLRREYRSRGEDLKGISAASTEELMDRAKRGRDPRENVSEAAFSDRLQNRNYTYSRVAREYGTERTSRTAKPHQTAGNTAKTGSAAGVHSKQTSRSAYRKNRSAQKAEEKTKEIKIRSHGISLGFITMLSIITVMGISVLFSIAQVYETTNTISHMENTLEKLFEEADELELALEKKNDIRVIEKIATEQLGMVKEDSVQRKYISLSDGERIDIIQGSDTEKAESPFGTMLSSIAAAVSRFFEGLGD